MVPPRGGRNAAGSRVKVTEIRNEAEFEALRPVWNELLAASAADTVFLTHEWLSEWWKAYGSPGDLRILLAHDGGGRLCGAAPLRRRTTRRYGMRYETLSFVGDGSGDSDYLDILLRRDSEEPAFAALFTYLRPRLNRGVVLELNSTPDSSPALTRLRRIEKVEWSETPIPCSTVRLPATWEEYLRVLGSRFRTKVRSVLRTAEAQPEARFELCTSPEQLETWLPALFDLHTRRWALAAKPGVYRGADKRSFYKAMSAAMLERGELFFSGMLWRGRLLACQFGFVRNGIYSQLQEGYEPNSEHWNPGIALRAWSIRTLLGLGVVEYDFLAGASRGKADWGAETKSSRNAVMAPVTPAGTLFCRGPEWEIAARQALKRHVSRKWLEERDARQERKRVESWKQRQAAASDEAASVPEWLRSVMSGAYYHSPAVHIARAVRDRYVLRGSSLSRRSHPTLRIVYYHRVNDENDPFLPSMPVDKFEEQIRLLARHYKIVSLREAMRRLDNGGPPEPVVAITFDDGYADNCTSALPVLERYGLPATVFLTTGSLDSREPMWFEELAVALKKAPETHVDLELDVPRRLSLRTEEERLEANATVFAWLRTLSDADRQDRMREILQRLNAPTSPELRGRMLTWNQVRDMHGRGFDFGGHTVTHPFVSKLTPERARWEIGECKRRIEQELQTPAEHFAYPNGREPDFEPWNKVLLAEAGYRAAVSTLWGVNYPGIDRMELRRGQPWEGRLSAFAAKLDWYQLRDE
jgi:peptidoglycan/xylan/chitin deacetylase (PgdA/CDA1 family)/CelD/BcsL family acetyltransferase involved in cellulose biosynthesis